MSASSGLIRQIPARLAALSEWVTSTFVVCTQRLNEETWVGFSQKSEFPSTSKLRKVVGAFTYRKKEQDSCVFH